MHLPPAVWSNCQLGDLCLPALEDLETYFCEPQKTWRVMSSFESMKGVKCALIIKAFLHCVKSVPPPIRICFGKCLCYDSHAKQSSRNSCRSAEGFGKVWQIASLFKGFK